MIRSQRSSWLRSFISPYRKSVWLALALGLIGAAFSALLMFAAGYLLSATAREGIVIFSVMMPIAFVQLFGIGKPLAKYFERLVSHNWVLRVTSDLRRMLFGHVAGNASDPTKSRASSEYLSLLSDDIAHLQNLYLRVIFPQMVAILLACLAAIAFGVFSPAFALAMLVVFLVFVVVVPMGMLIATRVRALKVKEMRAECFQKLNDDMAGIDDWRLSSRSDQVLAKHAQADAARRELDRKVRSYDRTVQLVSLLMLGLCSCVVIVWAGDHFGGDASTINWIAAFALGFLPVIESFAALPAAVPTATEHMQSINRLGDISNESTDAGNQTPFPEVACTAIEFDNVTYAYPGSEDAVLESFNCTIEQGQKMAVLGKSGSGKTTFASLMRGMLDPQYGSILIGGQQMVARKYDVSGTIGYLSQNPYIFNKTLRDNLTLARPDATDEELLSILGEVGLKECFDALPDGLDTVIGETGTGFSGGEAHRIALARTLIAHSKILIVDEPFAALDPATESDLIETLFNVVGGKTLVVITHHLAHIEKFDRVLFLEDGKIELDGRPAELLGSNVRFKELVEADRNL